jgi:ankyrin repeat protein
LNQTNVTDPLHYVSDCCFHGYLTNGQEARIAQLLLDHGANLDGNDGRESPLIGATSLGVPAVAEVLISTGADII